MQNLAVRRIRRCVCITFHAIVTGVVNIKQQLGNSHVQVFHQFIPYQRHILLWSYQAVRSVAANKDC